MRPGVLRVHRKLDALEALHTRVFECRPDQALTDPASAIAVEHAHPEHRAMSLHGNLLAADVAPADDARTVRRHPMRIALTHVSCDEGLRLLDRKRFLVRQVMLLPHDGVA